MTSNRIVIGYTTIEGFTAGEVDAEANAMLPEWQPLGPIQPTIDLNNCHTWYTQTMVKYEPAEPVVSDEREGASVAHVGYLNERQIKALRKLKEHHAALIYTALRLAGGSYSRKELDDALGIDRKTLSKGLAVLTELNLIGIHGDRNPMITLRESG